MRQSSAVLWMLLAVLGTSAGSFGSLGTWHVAQCGNIITNVNEFSVIVVGGQRVAEQGAVMRLRGGKKSRKGQEDEDSSEEDSTEQEDSDELARKGKAAVRGREKEGGRRRTSKRGKEEEKASFPLSVAYCDDCTAPTEYCSFFACARHEREKAEGDALSLGNLSISGNATSAGGADAPKKKAPQASKKPKNVVTIKLSKRGRKKFVTTLTGLEFHIKAPLSLKEAATVFSHSFACGASVVRGSNGMPDAIVVQGDVVQQMEDMCVSKFKVPPALVKSDESCRD